MGTGHVMRCLTLAIALRGLGVQARFISRNHPGSSLQLIRDLGFELDILPPASLLYSPTPSINYSEWLGAPIATDCQQTLEILRNFENVGWLVVDHYGIDATWEEKLAPYVKKILVIDDLANRKHQCDLLLDQTFKRSASDYKGLVPSYAEILCGTNYALLRSQFAEIRKYSLDARKGRPPKKLLISMGGTDPNNVTAMILEALAVPLPFDFHAIVVMGATAPHFSAIERLSKTLPFETELLQGVSNMPELMMNSDIAIGAAGSTAWERCCLGLPSIMVVLAENQTTIARALAEQGAATVIESPSSIQRQLSSKVTELFMDEKRRKKMIEMGSRITDGLGATRVAQKLESRQ